MFVHDHGQPDATLYHGDVDWKTVRVSDRGGEPHTGDLLLGRALAAAGGPVRLPVGAVEASGTSTTERLALIASQPTLESVDVGLEDLTDPDVRAVVIRADHPELDRALRDGQDEVTVAGEPISVRLHLTIHEVLATQLVDDDPPEVYRTAQRLLEPRGARVFVRLLDRLPRRGGRDQRRLALPPATAGGVTPAG